MLYWRRKIAAGIFPVLHIAFLISVAEPIAYVKFIDMGIIPTYIACVSMRNNSHLY